MRASNLLFIAVLTSFTTGARASKYLLNYSAFIPSNFECSTTILMTLNISFNFFNDHHFVTILDLSSEHHLDRFNCFERKRFRPVNIFKSLEDFKFLDSEANSVTPYPTTQGYFIRGMEASLIDSFYARVAKHNPKTKMLIQLDGGSFESAEEILKVGFEKHKILNVAVLVISNSQISLCMFNPFTAPSNFHCITFSESHSVEQLNDVQEFVKSRVGNLHKHPLRIDIFEYPLTSKAIYESGKIVKFSYVEGAFVEIASQIMNFTPIYVTPRGKGTFGYVYSNGTLTGSLAALEKETVDLVANARLISIYPTSKAVFLQAITTSFYKFIIQKRKTRRFVMLSLASQYDEPTKILTIALIVIFPFVYVVIKTVEGGMGMNSNSTTFTSVSQNLLQVFALWHNVSVATTTLASSRIIVITIVFYALIIGSLFQGIVVKNLNARQSIGAIKSIDELLDHDYNLLVTDTLLNIFKQQEGSRLSEKLHHIGMTRSLVTAEEGLKMVLKKNDVAFLWEELYIGSYLNKYSDELTGENLLEVVPEVAFEFYTALMVPKTSPFIERFNEIILRFVESGCNSFQVSLAFFDSDAFWYKRALKGQIPKKPSGSLSLRDLEDVFKLLCGLWMGCVVAFSIEIWVKRLIFKYCNVRR